jgi:hypothetical protein
MTIDLHLRQIFNLRDAFVNAIEYCPHSLIDTVYFKTIFDDLFSQVTVKTLTKDHPGVVGQILSFTALHNKIKYMSDVIFLNETLLNAIGESDDVKMKYLVYLIKQDEFKLESINMKLVVK